MLNYRIKTIGLLSALVLAALPALGGNIWIDENFDTGTAFNNLNYPVKDGTTTFSQATIAASQGINVRGYNTDATTAPISMVATGSLLTSSALAYSGDTCYQLVSGQSFGIADQYFSGSTQNNFNQLQFAIRASDASFALPSGTEVGKFVQQWHNGGYTADPDARVPNTTITVTLVKNLTNGIDVIVGNDSRKIGSLSRGSYSMFTLVVNKATTPQGWNCIDPFTSINKGPQPVGTTPATVPVGFNLFLNSNDPSDTLTTVTTNNFNSYGGNNTYLLNWSFTAEGGATFYVDDVFAMAGLCQVGQSVGGSSADHAIMNSEVDARQDAFFIPSRTAAAKDWNLFY